MTIHFSKYVKSADAYGAYMGGTNGLMAGGLVGGGLGGLYGAASGAYNAPKGEKLRGALTGAGRGMVRGGLVGGGVGAGLGASLLSQLPTSDIINAAKAGTPIGEEALKAHIAELNPNLVAGLATAGTVGGGMAGNLLADTLLNKKKDEKEEEPKAAAARERTVTRFGEGPKTVSFNASKKPPVKGFFNSLAAHVKGPEKEEKKEESKTAGSPILGGTNHYLNKMQAPQKPQPTSGLQAGAALAGAAQRVGQGAKTVANAVGNAPMLRDMLPKVDPAWGNTFWAGGNGSPPPVPQPQQPTHNMLQKTSAVEFGAMVKRGNFDWNSISSGVQSGLNKAYEGAKNIYNSDGVQKFVNDPTTRAGLMYGGIGAGLGGLYGAINPGEYEDANGQVQRRSRFMGALRGAGAGGAMLGLAGAGAQEGRYQYLKNLMQNQYGTAGGQIGPAPAPGVGLPSDRAGMQQAVESWAGQNAPSLQYSPLESAYQGYEKFVNPAMQNAQRLYKQLFNSSSAPADAAPDEGELILPPNN